MFLHRQLFIVISLCIGSFALAQEPIQFARAPDISPDGKRVTFSYLGDIWIVETIGGIARPITMHEAHDINPSFSPDGRWIAFSSNRFGSYDVFVVPTYGGKPRRLTFDSAQDMAIGWAPNSSAVHFMSSRGTGFPQNPECYAISVDGGRERKLPYREAKDVQMSPVGGGIAFTRGPGTWYRKGYRGSSNDDLWLANADGSVVRRVTDFNGQDTAPMWSADGKRLYYVSEVLGNPANIVCQEVNPGQSPPSLEGKPKAVTTHQSDAVRRARISAGGDWIVYECGADLWIISTKGGTPRKLAIEVHADEKSNSEKITTFTNGITEYVLSPDESHIAFTVHGELFLMPATGGKAKRLTESPSVEHGVSFSPDGKKILFLADHGGQEDVYSIEQDDPEHPELTKAHRFKTTRLTNTAEAEIGAHFTPDGSRILFIRAGKLYSMKPDGTDLKTLVDQQRVFDYDWSPDGKWIVYARTDGSFGGELYIIPIDGSKPPHNITRYATINAGVTWNNSAGKIAFVSRRANAEAIFVISLQKPAAPGAASSTDIDFDDIHLRVERPGNNTGNSGEISRNGRLIAYSAVQNGSDLWVVATDGSLVMRMTTGNQQPNYIRWAKNNSRIWFLDGTGALKNTSLGLGLSGTSPTVNTISFTAKMTVKRDEEFAEMFEQSWRNLANNFYDQGHHGADWKAVREKYLPMVKHVALKEDLYSLISLMMGELNASHLGISGTLPRPEEVTADLGLIFDDNYAGPGLKIQEVLKRGPADKRGLNLAAGEVIVALEGTPLTDKTNISKLLNARTGEMVLAEITSNPNDPKVTKRKVELACVSREQVSELMYQRWIARNAAETAARSNNTVGYVHIRSMDEPSLEQFIRSLYSDHFEREGLLIDVRYNGGGFTHERILNYLGAKEHTFFRQRDGGQGLVLRSDDRKWTKPVAVLTNSQSYSDAEIFPHAFKTMGLGKVIGEPTGGAVIGTAATRLIDGSMFRLPRIGVYTVQGINMEKEGVKPDILVPMQPEDLVKGNDLQITKGVEVLLQDVVIWKKNRTTVVGGGTPSNPGPMRMPAVPVPPKQP